MKIIKTQKYKGSLIFKISIIALLIFVVGTLANQQIIIRRLESSLNVTEMKIQEQTLVNEEIRYSIEQGASGGDEYIEKYARGQLNYAKQGERVFVNIGGN